MVKSFSFAQRTAVAAFVAATLAAATAARSADLPIPCVAGTCGAAVTGFVTSGSATATTSGKNMRIDQRSDKAVLNWSSFDVSADGKVTFNQPSSSSIALNRIHSASPSQIFGAVEANGQIYLVNQNGIVFGAGSKVRTAGLVASTLGISDEVFDAGLAAPRETAALGIDTDHAYVLDAQGKRVKGADGKYLEVKLTVQQGAEISTIGAGQRVLLAGQQVENAGTITAAKGQAILAAGKKVYLQASNQPELRGLLIEVDPVTELDLADPNPPQDPNEPENPTPTDPPPKNDTLDRVNTAWNRLTGQISAAQGNVTLVGLAVNQEGRLSATTSINANGSVRLLARAGASTSGGPLTATQGGTLNIGSGSDISIRPELDDPATAVDDQAQLASSVELSGQKIFIQSNTKIVAPGGKVTVTAQKAAAGPALRDFDSAAQIRLHSGAVIDVSGTHATAPVTRNLVTVELRANELADSPLQRDGVLRGQTVVVDARVGTPLANIDGALKSIQRTVGERTSKGGTIAISSEGDVVVSSNAVLDVSGGRIDYTPGVIQTTKLKSADGRLFDIGSAPKDLVYTAIINPTKKISYDRWGVTQTIAGPQTGRYDPGYMEGRDGGTLAFAAPVMSLNGTFLGNTVTGALQRDPAKMPVGALFQIGDLTERPGVPFQDYRTSSVNLVEKASTLVIADGASLNAPRSLELPVDFLSSGGFQRTAIYANGSINVSLPDPLQLLPGSTFSLTAHRVNLGSDIVAPSGTISAKAVFTGGVPGIDLPEAGVTVAKGVTLDVRGRWTNDAIEVLENPAARPLSPVFKDAGRIQLVNDGVGGTLGLGDEVSLLASGGAWMQADTSLKGGKGGEITLLGGLQNSAFDIGANTHIEAFGVNGAAGGTFNFEAWRVQVANGSSWVSPTADVPHPWQAQAFGAGENITAQAQIPDPRAEVTLGSALFTNHGFATFNINAAALVHEGEDANALSIVAGAQIAPVVRSHLLDAGAQDLRSGANVQTFSSIYTPLENLRAPVALSFGVITPRRYQPELQAPVYGALDFAAGSFIRTDAGSSVKFSSVGGLTLGGDVHASAGSISAQLVAPGAASTDLDPGYLPGLALNVLQTARFDVSGLRILTPNDTGVLDGKVLGGGKIELLADRGSVNVLAGSQLLANGGSGLLDLPDLAHPASGYSRTLVGSAGGSISVRAPESILLAGDMSARAGASSAVTSPGGSLSVQLTRDAARGFSTAKPETFPTNDRILQLTDGQTFFGTSAPNGFASVDSRKVVAGGFDALTLESSSRIEIDSKVNLSLARELRLDSGTVAVTGDGNARLAAAYVSFGRTLKTLTAPQASIGSGQLSISGDLIDITGDTAVSGVTSVLFSSAGDIRLRGFEEAAGIHGSMTSTGDITLRAARLYTTTLTSFAIESAGGSGNTVRVEQTNASSGVPLSAGGNLSIKARNIVQAGTVIAPFGQISLTATDKVTFAPGSVTSVSAGDTTIPFGTISLGDWQYDVLGNLLAQTSVPTRQIEVDASDVVMEQGSTIDLRGGGDLTAYEWTPGTGGTTDALAPGVRPTLFAVLPSMRGQSGAYDTMAYANSGLKAGDSVYLGGSSLLPEGVYPLLPARYALLPGAILVEARSDFSTMAAGSIARLADGATVVAGRRTYLNTGLGAAQYSGFAIRDGSYGKQLASYTDTRASTFFPDRAKRLELETRAAIPADAATLSLNISQRLDARGNVETKGAAGGIGASIDIAAPNLEIVGTGAGTLADAVQVQASALERWNPSRLLLGGRRTSNGVEVLSDSVVLDDGVSLVHDEVLVAAKEEIQLGDGSRVASRASQSTRLSNPDFASTLTSVALTGEGAAGAAVLGVSDLSRLQIDRPKDAVADVLGGIFVKPSAAVASRSALLIDAPGGGELEGTLDGAGASWDVVSSRLSFSDTPQESGLTITPGVANAIGKAYNARLASRTSIDFYDSVSFGAGVQSVATLTDLTLSASSIRARGTDTTVSLGAAHSLVFEGATEDKSQETGSGTLRAQASEISFGGGDLSFLGFGNVSLDASDAVLADGKSHVRVDVGSGGKLDIRTPMLSASNGAELTLVSDGAVSLHQRQGAPGSQVSAAGLGVALSIQAASIDLNTKILQPSGLVTLSSAGALNLGADALIDVGGALVNIQGREAMSPAGTIRLISGGDLTADANARLNVAAGQSAGGSLLVQSLGAARLDAAMTGGVGATFDLFAGSLGDFASLNRALESAGFTGERSVRVAAGDLTLGAGETITARSVSLTADGGRVDVFGTINARSQDSRATLSLFGAQGVAVSAGATLHADGIGESSRGGIVTLGTETGRVDLAPGSVISTSGTEKGQVQIRAAFDEANRDVNVSRLGASFVDVSQVAIEGFKTVTNTAGVLNQAGFDAYQQQIANTFGTDTGGKVAARLGVPRNTLLTVGAGLDVRREGNLEVDTLDLRNAHVGGHPLNLTVRATGNIGISGTISDGFAVGGTRVNMLDGESASLRFAAGATLASANMLAVTPGLASDINIAAGSIVRTGTGAIGLAASHDLKWKGAASIYTAGNQAIPTDNGATLSFGLPTGGGALSFYAGNSILGAPITQAPVEWQPRRGSATVPTMWAVDVARFGWNAGSLGGGDVKVRAGGNVENLSVAAADSAAENRNGLIDHYGGGVLDIDAVGDVSSLYAHVTHGTNTIRAGGALGRVRTNDQGALGSLFSIEDASVAIRARSGIAIEGAFNPTVLIQTNVANSQRSFFFTYGADSLLDAVTAAGDVFFKPTRAGATAFLGATVGNGSQGSTVVPPGLRLQALSGDVSFEKGNGTMAPSNIGQLDILAARDVIGGSLQMSDTAETETPSPFAPSNTYVPVGTPGGLGGSGRHLGDTVPVQITAGRDILGATLSLAKASQVTAGRDIFNTSILGQNLLATEVTSIFAGRDIRYDSGVGSTQEIQLGGPGSLVVMAGRNVDLGFSEGITSIGSTLNPSLATLTPQSTDGGADISVIAGYGPGLKVDGFLTKIVDGSDQYEKGLVDFIASLSPNAAAPSYATARSQFLLMDRAEQIGFISRVFFSELVKSGREVNADPTLGFDRGYAAIDALFPGSRPGEKDPPSPYAGDILLTFSRIYSLSDGTISLFAPGGLLNVGLANPPEHLPVMRFPADLGIVAQRAGDVRIFTAGDVLVNASRIFTLGGGDIAVWSTLGDIDAGRGAKSAISAPPPVITIDAQGNVKVDFGAAVQGSGIRTIIAREGVAPGDVDLIAPAGIVNAGDAGIGSAGNLNVAAQQVVGLDNIQVGGSSSGVPAETSSLGASLSGASAASTSASSSSSETVEQRESAGPAPLADTALGWLDVFIEGFGEEVCKSNDQECLQRNRREP